VIPYEYSRFDFCAPPTDDKTPTENLGQVVFGERIRPSSYNVRVWCILMYQKMCLFFDILVCE